MTLTRDAKGLASLGFASHDCSLDTAVEINIGAALLNREYPEHFSRQYLDYVAGLKDRGVRLSLASDCHSASYDTDFATAEEMLKSVGITDADLWKLPTRKDEP